MMNRLWRKPILYTRWEDEEQNEAPSSWIELYSDLLYVYAMSSCAETIEEGSTAHTMALFMVMALTFVSTWMIYNYYSIRFLDMSLFHDTLLALHLITVLGMAVNVGNSEEQHGMVALWMIATRVTLMMIFAVPFCSIPEAYHTICITFFVGFTSIVLYAVSYFCAYDTALILWTVAVVSEITVPIVISSHIEGSHLRIHVDHMADRLGDLIMVTIGESIVSIAANKLKEMDTYYYMCFAFAVLQSFALALLYYHITPNEHWHALRRSKWTGWSWSTAHRFLVVGFLAQAAGMKWALEAAAEHEDMEYYQISMFVHATVTVRLLCSFLRICHFGFRDELNQNLYDPHRNLKYAWWSSLLAGNFLPYYIFALHSTSPMCVLGVNAAINFGLSLIETSFTHVLDRDEGPYGHLQFEGRPGAVAVCKKGMYAQNTTDEQTPMMTAPIDNPPVRCDF